MNGRFYDFNVHSQPESDTSLSKLCEVAKRYGYSGLAITNHSDYFDIDIDPVMSNFEVINGVEIVSDPSDLKEMIRKFRPKVTLLSVHGGDERVNRIAVEDKRIDILCHPESERESGLNHVLARSATKNDVAIEFDMGAIIHN
ncbi:MAG: RNase P subunit p30 family protein, partial [Halobacteriota archaeon]|nr:RNase P subunit p30 family protein [Halobacteriota archaeon]